MIDTIAVAGTPDSVAFKPDGTRAHVTLSGANELAIVNTATATQITGSPFALTAANDTPLGILTTTNHGEIYAYTAKQNPTGKGAVDVVDVTTDPTTTLNIVTNIAGIGATGSKPNSLAATTETPDPLTIYVTLTGGGLTTSQGAQLDNSVTTPVLTDLFDLPDPTKPAGTAGPLGITIPPLSPLPTDCQADGALRVFVAEAGTSEHDVGILDDVINPPVLDCMVPLIDLGADAAPSGIASIPVPQ